MNRREFMLVTAAAAAVPALAQAGAKTLEYEKGLIEKHLAAGDTVYVDFKTDWCSTCRAMSRRVEKLVEEHPAYGENIVFIDVDFDRWGSSSLTRKLNVPNRSTHIVLKGDQELARVYAKSSERAIKALLDAGLQAATGSS